MADLSFNVVALDRASRVFVQMATEVEKLARRLDSLDRKEVRVKVDVDQPKLATAINGIAQLSRSIATLVVPAATITGIAAAAPAVAGLGAAAVTTAGALWLLPAAGVAAGVAVGAVAVGVQGFGEAMKNRADPEKFAESIAKLSPAARDAAVTIRDLGPAWTELRLDVQERLFAGVAGQVQALSTAYLPVLRDVLGGVAGGFNQAATGISAFLTSQPGVTDMSTGLGLVRDAVSTAAQAAVPLVRAFTDIFVVGAGFLPGFAGSITDVATRFSEFIAGARESGELATWIQDGVSALGQLGDIAGSAGGILKSVFDAATASGVDTFGATQRLTGELDRFLSSGVGSDAMVTVFTTINQVVDALLPGLTAVADAIATGIVALGPALPPLAASFTEIAIAMTPLISDLALLASVILPPLAATLSFISPLLGPLAAGFIGLWVVNTVTTAFVAVRTAMIGFAVAQGAITVATGASLGILGAFKAAILGIGFALAANPIGILITVLIAVGAALTFAYFHIEPFRNAVDTAFRAVADAGIWMWENALRPAFDGIMAGLKWVGDAATWLWSSVIVPAFEGISLAARILFAIVATVLITPLYLAFQLIAATVTWLWENVWRPVFQAIGDFAGFVWNSLILPAFDALVGFVNGVLAPIVMWLWNSVIRPAFDGIGAVIAFTWNSIIRPAFDGIVGFVNGVLGPVVMWFWNNVVKPAWDGIGAIINFAWENVIRPVFDGIRTGVDLVGRAFETAVGFIGRVWDGVKAAVRNPIQAVIDVVYNNGVVKVWNFVAGLVGLAPLSTYTLPAFKDGGRIPGRADQAVPMIGHGDEHVWTDEEVRGAGGHAAVERMRAQARGRAPGAVFAGLQSGRMIEGADHDGPGATSTGFGGVQPHVARAGWYLKRRFGIASVGGVGQRANASDHPKGLALDFMTYRDTGKGDALVNYLLPNAGHFAVKYIIWKQRINSGGGWRGMEDRGSATANHFDHPHVSFLAGPGLPGGFAGAEPPFDPLAWLTGAVGNILGLADGLRRGNPWLDAMAGLGKKIVTLAWEKALSFVTPSLAGVVDTVAEQNRRGGGIDPVFANGGIVTRPTFGLIGEDGAEAVVPLTKPARARQVMAEAGLGSTGGGALTEEFARLRSDVRDLVAVIERQRPIVVEDRSGDPVQQARLVSLNMRGRGGRRRG